MKRLLVLVAVLAPLSLFVAGCGGSGGASSEKAAVEKTKPLMVDAQKTMQEKMSKKAGGAPAAPK